MSPTVVCRQCGGPIASRQDLHVVGRALVPVHRACHAGWEAAQPWHQRGWLPMNRWTSLLAFNAVLVLVAVVAGSLRPEVPLRGVLPILAAANAWLLVGRLVSWRTVERHLPPRPRAPGAGHG